MPIISSINHIQVTVPSNSEVKARVFYCDVLGLKEVEKPVQLKANGGFWLEVGSLQVHIGLEDSVDRHVSKAHIAFEIENEKATRALLQKNGVCIIESTQIPGFKRFDIRDPFGNRIEFMQRI